MAVYSGILGLSVLIGSAVSVSAEVSPAPQPVVETQGFSGSHVHSPLFYYPEERRSGALGQTSPLWDRVIVSPTGIDAGLVVQNTDFSGYIWNTKTRNITVNNYSLQDIDGVVLNPTPPFTVGALNDVPTRITVLVEGSPILDGYLLYEVDEGVLTTYRTYIQGLRGLIFSFPPGFPYVEGERFRTSVFRSYTGREVRKALLEKTKFRWSYKVKLTEEDLQKVQRFVRYALRPTILHPVWSSLSHLTQDTDGTTTIYLDTANRDFQPGDYLLLKNDSYEDAVQIESVGAGQITLKKPPRYQFYAGDMVVPLKPAILKQVQRLTHRSVWGEIEIEAEEV